MSGMIQDQMAPPQAAPQPQQAAPQGGGDQPITPDSLMSQMQLNPQQKPQLQRIVIAGMKVMFDPKTHQLMLQTLQGQGPLTTKIGQGVAGLMGLLVKESNNSLPPDLLIPAAIVLIAHAADFLNKSGMQVSNEDIGGAIDECVSAMLKAFKIDPEHVQAIAGQAEASAGAGGGAQPQAGAQ